jgi:hypothetical protein
VVFFRAADQAMYIQTESYPGAFVPCLDLFYSTYLVMLYAHLSYKSDLVAVWNHSVPCYPDLVHLNIDRSKKIQFVLEVSELEIHLWYSMFIFILQQIKYF